MVLQALERIESNEYGYREKLDELHELQDAAEYIPAVENHAQYKRILDWYVQRCITGSLALALA